MQVPGRLTGLTRVATGLVAVAAVALLVWTAGSTGIPENFRGRKTDYYNLLVAGFREGHLHMKVTPDPRLGPGMPSEPPRAGAEILLDASYYRGKYYLYFGATPAVLLFLPWAVLVGHDLPEWFAGAILATAVLLTALGWLAMLRREFLPVVSPTYWLAATITLGLGAGLPVVLRPAKFYQVAILSGVTFMLSALLCLTLALRRPSWGRFWIALAGLSVGLAAGSRPTLIPGGILAVAVAVVWLWRKAPSADASWTRGWKLAAAAFAPMGACFAAIGWYNWARYDSPFEFGLHYQLGSNPNGFPFTLEALWRNLRVYYSTPPDVGWYFPFFAPGPKPAGSNPEETHGMFLFVPLMALLAGVVLWKLRRWRELPSGLAAIVAATLGWAGTTFLIVASSPNHSDRYALDFHPPIVVLALLAVLACGAGANRWQRWVGRAALTCLVAVCAHGFFIPFQTHGYFRDASPESFAATARVFNRLVWPVHRLTGPVIGGLEFRVTFPASSPGKWEPVFVAGAGTELDGILLRHTGDGRARFVFDHQDFGGPESLEFDLRPGVPRRLELRLGTLMPPDDHPWYDKQPANVHRLRSRVSLRLDGVEVLGADIPCYPASAGQIAVGRRRGLAIGEEAFAGLIEYVGALEPDHDWLASLEVRRGPLAIRAGLPRDRFGAREPLLVTGARGRQDLLLIEYVSDREVRFVAQHEGDALLPSAPIPIDYSRPHEFLIHHGPAGHSVWLDGQLALVARFSAHPAEPWQFWAGCTPWTINTSRNLFAGQMESVQRRDIGSPSLLSSGRPLQLELVLPADRAGACEPLLTTGVAGRGDNLFVRYVDGEHIAVGLDHWGVGGAESRPVAVNYRARQTLVVSHGALLRPGDRDRDRLRVELNGVVILDLPQAFYPATPTQSKIGENHIGASTSLPKFSGIVLDVRPR